ncbi:MAG: hypothetical protein ACRD0P_04975 [Stackebrandtia sp.]
MELRRHLDKMPFELRTLRDVEAKQILLPALAALLVAISLTFILDLTRILSWALLGCIALVIVMCLFAYLRYGGRPVLAADTDRIWIRIGNAAFAGIGWAELENLRTTSRGVHSFLLWDCPTAAEELANSPRLWKATASSRAAFDTPFVIAFTSKDHDRRQTVTELKRLAPEGTRFNAATSS